MYSLLFLLSLILSSPSWGRQIIISDIDDTLKISPGLKVSGLFSILRGESPAYMDMQILYREWQSRGAVFIYLSSSYRYFYDGEAWLKEHGFPEGKVHQRDEDSSLDGQTYKRDKLVEIFREFNPEEENDYYFIGDNYGGDDQVYSEFVKSSRIESRSKIMIRDMLLITLSSPHPMLDFSSDVKYFISINDILPEIILWPTEDKISFKSYFLLHQSFYSRRSITDPQKENLVQRLKGSCHGRDQLCRNKMNSKVGTLLGGYFLNQIK